MTYTHRRTDRTISFLIFSNIHYVHLGGDNNKPAVQLTSISIRSLWPSAVQGGVWNTAMNTECPSEDRTVKFTLRNTNKAVNFILFPFGTSTHVERDDRTNVARCFGLWMSFIYGPQLKQAGFNICWTTELHKIRSLVDQKLRSNAKSTFGLLGETATNQ